MRTIIVSLFLLILCGCSVQMPQQRWTTRDALTSANFPSTPVKIKGDIRAAIQSSLSFYKNSPQQIFEFGPTKVNKIQLVQSLMAFDDFLATHPDEKTVSSYLKNNFTYYQSAADQVLITGYYVPEIEGSLQKDTMYKFPLYATPDDLVTVSLEKEIKDKLGADVPVINRGRILKNNVSIPYFSRKQIDTENILSSRNLEILYLKDPLERFFAHIQGSVHVRLPNGEHILAAYDNKNGHPYRAIGKRLIEMGLLERNNTTMDTIKVALRNNPSIQEEVLNWNPSYVFFKLTKDSAKGSLSTPVVGQVSIATDQSLFPKGSLGLMKLNNEWILVANHDTGGAITGPGRVDYFFGQGEVAGNHASGLQSGGMIGFLAPKPQ